MSNWSELLGDWLLRTSVEGSVLIAAVLGLSWLLGRHLGPRWRVILWALVGFKLLIPAFVPVASGLGNWLRSDPVPEMIESATPLVSEADESAAPAVESLPEMRAASPLPVLPAAGTEPGISLSSLLLYVWLLGSAGFAVAMFVRQQRFASCRRRSECRDRRLLALVREVAEELGVRRDIQVLLSPEGSTPAVFGAWRSRLLLPADWEQRFDIGSLRHILMHEIEHIRYRDVLWNWAAAAVNAIHWFNPLVWIAVSRFQSDRELRCDAGTVSRLDPAERIAYGQTLLRVQKEFISAPAIAGVAPCVRNHPTLRHRILMITNPTDKKSWLNAILTLAVAGLVWFSFGSARADEERSSREGSREGSTEREGARDGERERERESDRPRREGDREREGDRSREGDREREGDRPRRESDREREGDRPMVREGELKLTVVRDGVVIGDKKIALVNLRRELDSSRAKTAVVFAQPDVSFRNVNTVMNSLKNSGIGNVRIGGIEGEGAPLAGPREGDDVVRRGPRDGESAPRTGPRDGEGPPKTGPRDGEGAPSREGARDGDRPREGSREGDRPREGVRDGEGTPSREGARDGDRPREGSREGDHPREGARDGEGTPSREGARDGDRPREGSREGDRPREGARDGEGTPSREGARDGDRPREGSREGDRPREGEGSASREGARDGGNSSIEMDDRQLAQLTRIYRTYDKNSDKGVTFEEWVAMKNYKLSADQTAREQGWFDQADSNSDKKVTLGEWIDWKASQ